MVLMPQNRENSIGKQKDIGCCSGKCNLDLKSTKPLVETKMSKITRVGIALATGFTIGYGTVYATLNPKHEYFNRIAIATSFVIGALNMARYLCMDTDQNNKDTINFLKIGAPVGVIAYSLLMPAAHSFAIGTTVGLVAVAYQRFKQNKK